MLIRDSVANFTLNDAFLQEHLNEAQTIDSLRRGMKFLYVRTRAEELSNHGPSPLAISYFRWFAVSGCDYVRIIGHLRHLLDASAPTPAQYQREVLPEVSNFRDKIAAHSAGAQSSSWDTDADRYFSFIGSIAVQGERFWCSPYDFYKTPRNSESGKATNVSFSVTLTHEALMERYGGNVAELEDMARKELRNLLEDDNERD